MSATEQHERFAEDIGAYLLGALDEREEKNFEDHLRTCHLCQDEVGRLTVARDALPRAVSQMVPPPELKAALMATVESEAAARHELLAPAAASRAKRDSARTSGGWLSRVFSRPAYAAAAASLVLFVGVGAGVIAGGVGGSDAREVAGSVDTDRLAETATARLVVDDEGGDARLHVEGMPQPVAKDVYEVWVRRGDKVSPVSLFDVNTEGEGVASIPESLEGADEVMVTRERRGGVDVPTEDPVVSIKL